MPRDDLARGQEVRHDEAQQREQARAEIRTLARYARPAWAQVLEEVAARPMTRKNDISSFLSRSEASELAKATLGYARLGETFPHAP